MKSGTGMAGAGPERGKIMYSYYYQTPIMNYVNHGVILGIAVVLSALLGIVLFFTFFRKKNEGKYTGVKGKLYHFMNFNRFYAEEILRFLYIVAAICTTVCGIVSIILGSFLMGICQLIVLNVVLRIVFELLMMFIMLCRKTVSVDRRLSQIEKYYDDGYDAYCEEEEEEGCCSGACESCEEYCEESCGPEDIPF
ncbi:MAG: hypothetical protein ACI4LJ_08105 [Anaerovoracaceae bacterium]